MPYIYDHTSTSSSYDSNPTHNDEKSDSQSYTLTEFEFDDDYYDIFGDLEADEDTYVDYDYDQDSDEEIHRATIFFENIERALPDIEQISADVTTDITESETLHSSDGQFVDPITGEKLYEAQQTFLGDDEYVEEEEDEETEESEESELISDSELTFPEETEEEVIVEQTEEEEMAFGAFLDMDVVKKVTLEEYIDYDKLQLEYEEECERQGIIEFLERIIARAIYRAEFASSDVQLRKKVDKNLVMAALRIKSVEYEDSRDQRNFLEKKCVEYYKRKKSYRAITLDQPKTYEEDRLKFYQALARLDEWLQREISETEKHADLIQKLKEELQQLKEESVIEIAEFETLLKKSCQLDHRPNLNKMVDKLFRYMNQLRAEINDLRFQLISIQHVKVDLETELSKYNTFDHVNIKDLENMCMSINHDLKKLRVRCRSNIHTMAHYMEKQKMLLDAVHNQKLALEDLHEERMALRRYIFRLKIQRSELRTGINTINFLNSLIDKPTLMLDFDQTMADTLFNAEIINNLKNQKKQLEDEISKLLRKCVE